MVDNRLKEICESEGIRQIELSTESGVAYGTVNKVYNNNRTVAPVTRAKLAKAASRLAGNEYSVADVFPEGE